jgi:hypothetical protein
MSQALGVWAGAAGAGAAAIAAVELAMSAAEAAAAVIILDTERMAVTPSDPTLATFAAIFDRNRSGKTHRSTEAAVPTAVGSPSH